MLQCTKCKSLTHYGCTQLPTYQVSLFMLSGYRRYVCVKCVGSIHQDILENCSAPLKFSTSTRTSTTFKSIDELIEENKKTSNELMIKLDELERVYDEKTKLRNDNLHLKSTIGSLEDQIKTMREKAESHGKKKLSNHQESGITEAYDRLNIEHKMLDLEMTETQKCLEEKTFELTRLLNENKTLHQKINVADKEEIILRNDINDRDKNIKDLQTIKDTHIDKNNMPITLNDVQSLISDKFNKIEEHIDRLIVQKISESSKLVQTDQVDEKRLEKFEEKIDEKLNTILDQNKTYSASVKNSEPPGSDIPFKVNTDFRTIMKQTRNEELAEESEKKLRASNFIIHGMDEPSSTEKNGAKKEDEEFIRYFFGALLLRGIAFKFASRIGKTDSAKKRPIKVIMNNEEDKLMVMANLRNLKDKDSFRGISVTDDYTVAERQIIKEYADKAKAKNDQESSESKHVWRVRGTPKNGLQLKKLLKQRRAVSQD